jgi:hypothetical protein
MNMINMFTLRSFTRRRVFPPKLYAQEGFEYGKYVSSEALRVGGFLTICILNSLKTFNYGNNI